MPDRVEMFTANEGEYVLLREVGIVGVRKGWKKMEDKTIWVYPDAEEGQMKLTRF